MAQLSELPIDIIKYVGQQLDDTSIVRLFATCREFKNALHSPYFVLKAKQFAFYHAILMELFDLQSVYYESLHPKQWQVIQIVLSGGAATLQMHPLTFTARVTLADMHMHEQHHVIKRFYEIECGASSDIMCFVTGSGDGHETSQTNGVCLSSMSDQSARSVFSTCVIELLRSFWNPIEMPRAEIMASLQNYVTRPQLLCLDSIRVGETSRIHLNKEYRHEVLPLLLKLTRSFDG